MNTLETTKKILKENGIVIKKKLGQNFLIDDLSLSNIVDSAEITKGDVVIEIGPGLGNLTEYILNAGASIIAFEIDKNMEDILIKRFGNNKNFKLFIKDFLTINLEEYIPKGNKIKVIANLPYYITTPIIFKLLKEAEQISSIVIMVQKEVADRLISKPGSKSSGVLTINTQYKSNIEKLFDVPNNCFIPAPNVISSVIKITPDKQKQDGYNINNENIFRETVKASFLARRKKLANSLEVSSLKNKYNLAKEDIVQILKECNIDSFARAEELQIQDFANISNEFDKRSKGIE